MRQYITTWERRAEAKGLEQGLEQGFEKGLKIGLKAGLAASFGSSSRALLESRVEACTDLPALERLATALSENTDLASLKGLLP